MVHGFLQRRKRSVGGVTLELPQEGLQRPGPNFRDGSCKENNLCKNVAGTALAWFASAGT